jgi:hypothetical protein
MKTIASILTIIYALVTIVGVVMFFFFLFDSTIPKSWLKWDLLTVLFSGLHFAILWTWLELKFEVESTGGY